MEPINSPETSKVLFSYTTYIYNIYHFKHPAGGTFTKNVLPSPQKALIRPAHHQLTMLNAFDCRQLIRQFCQAVSRSHHRHYAAKF